MSLFMLDTAGDQKLHEKNSFGTPVTKKTAKCLDVGASTKDSETFRNEDNQNQTEEIEDFLAITPDINALINSTLSKTTAKQYKTTQALEDVSISIDAALENTQQKKRSQRKKFIDLDHSDFNTATGKFDDEQLTKVNVSEVISKSNVRPDLEQLKELPRLSKFNLAKLNRIERAKTKGGDWYNLPATEVTDDVKNELKVLQMRSVLDPKHFYKKNDLKVLPKYFQIGTVLPSPLDYYSERNTRKTKKLSLVDELLSDTKFQSYNKRKYNEAMALKSKYAKRKAMKKMKKLKKKK